MELWTQNNWRTPQHGKSDELHKQTDDFQAAFPNFMTLTDEERRAFFQTLQAAKIKLESSGVSVQPFFGTVHDQSWSFNASDNISCVQDDASISLASKAPAQSLSSNSSGLSGSFDAKKSIASESFEKILKEDGFLGKYSEENLGEVLGRNYSLESFGFEEKEVDITNFNGLFNMMKIPKTNPAISSLSYEILNKGDNVSIYQEQKEDTLKIKGTKLKVQVKLTSADNERMKRVLLKPKKADTWSSASEVPEQYLGDKKKIYGEVKFVEEKIDDPEIKDLLNVEKESVEELPEEEKKTLFDIIPKRPSESKKELKSENYSYKAEEGNKEVKNKLSFRKEYDKERTLQQRTETNILMENEMPKKKENDEDLVKISCNPKDDKKAIQQRILSMNTVHEGTGSSTKPKKQESKATSLAQRQFERQKRVEKLKKCLQKREIEYQKIKKKIGLKAQGEEKSPELMKETTTKEEVEIEKNSVSMNSENEEETQSTTKEKTVLISCIKDEEEVTEEEKKSAEAEAVASPDLAQAGDAAGETEDWEEKKTSESTTDHRKDNKQCDTPFKPGKVVFVDDNVIQKIRKVIMDLEKKAKGEDNAENEYLILLVDYVEYLSTVIATLFENRVDKQPAKNPNVRFDEENLQEIEQILRTPSSTTEDEFDSNKQLEIKKKCKYNKPRKASFMKSLGKCFRCGNSKNKTKGRKP